MKINPATTITHFLFLLLTMGCTTLHATPQRDLEQADALVRRLIPGVSAQIKTEILTGGQDRFEVESVDGKVVLRGNNANSIAVGLNHYLKQYCHCNVSWYADNPVEIPQILPEVSGKIAKDARCDNRFFINYCTFGYTMPWWQWRDWERFIDWMALNGVTMPLAITGQEAVWYRVWEKFGLNDQQIRSYFTGPAHLPWHRMANIDYWQGPLPQSWLTHQLELQKKIVDRERQLNMTPVLPAFAGHVPAALKTVHPSANINKLGHWGGFDGKYRSSFLDPLDPLFKKIQKEFLTEQTKLFGTDHIYGTDPFNEVEPPSWEPEYLAQVGQAIHESMTEVDPDASWLQMTWVFYFDRKHWTNERIEAMVRSVPQDKMILLDYYCESQEVWKMTEQFFGQPYIWCYLGNFGGNTMLAGNLKTVESRIENTFKNGGDKVWGLGSTLEALDVNPVMYEFLFEKAWTDKATDLETWIANYADTRCGAQDEKFREGWDILLKKVYTRASGLGQGVLMNARPSLGGNGSWTTSPYIQYDNRDLLRVWKLFLETGKKDRDAYQYDLVNVSRQVLGNHFKTLRDQLATAYYLKNEDQAKAIGKQMLELLDDMEMLLATRSEFMLGKWLEDAKSFAANDDEVAYYEKNARTLLTTWGVRGQSLNDYANRSWAGLVKGFYRERWQMFVSTLLGDIAQNRNFNEAAFKEKVKTFEWDWTNQSELYCANETGDAVQISKALFKKYSAEIAKPVTLNKIRIAGWNPSTITQDYQVRTMDFSKHVGSGGQYAILFDYSKGGHAAQMKEVELLENGKVVSSDRHTGRTGYENSKRVFQLELNQVEPHAQYQLRFSIRSDGGSDSTGRILLYRLSK